MFLWLVCLVNSLPAPISSDMDHPLAGDADQHQHHTDVTQLHNYVTSSDVDAPPPAQQQQAVNERLSSAVTSQRGACLSLSDHDRLRIFVHEFLVRGLIPWAERTLRILSDQVQLHFARVCRGSSTVHESVSGSVLPLSQPVSTVARC